VSGPGFSTAEKRRRYGRPCATGCGRLTSGSNGAGAAPLLCVVCYRHQQGEEARSKAIACIHEWHRRYGRPPKADEWRAGVAPYPTVSLIQYLFGSWAGGIRAAGYEPRKPGRPKRGDGVNFCRICRRDFSSLKAFDRHRVGRYEPLGRRCLDSTELVKAGFRRNGRGRWELAAHADRARTRFPVGAERPSKVWLAA
jgi:hypothetical protein